MKMGMLEKVSMNVANPLSPGIRHVIDGRSLLHRIRWPMQVITYGQLVDRYVQYVDRQYGPNSQVIFDGYPENTPTTKDEGHMRWEGKTTAPNISVDKAIIVNVDKDPFLANKHNLTQLIDILMAGFANAGSSVAKTEEDVNRLIARSSIESAQNFLTMTHAEDTDILVILLSYLSDSPHDVVSTPYKKKVTNFLNILL